MEFEGHEVLSVAHLGLCGWSDDAMMIVRWWWRQCTMVRCHDDGNDAVTRWHSGSMLGWWWSNDLSHHRYRVIVIASYRTIALSVFFFLHMRSLEEMFDRSFNSENLIVFVLYVYIYYCLEMNMKRSVLRIRWFMPGREEGGYFIHYRLVNIHVFVLRCILKSSQQTL